MDAAERVTTLVRLHTLELLTAALIAALPQEQRRAIEAFVISADEQVATMTLPVEDLPPDVERVYRAGLIRQLAITAGLQPDRG